MRGKVPFRPPRSPRYHLCAMCRYHRRQRMAAHWHHLIGRQRLHRYVGEQSLLPVEAFALERRLTHDERNLMALCKSCHTDRHGGLEAVIPRAALPEDAWEFARELGLEHVLERRYV